MYFYIYNVLSAPFCFFTQQAVESNLKVAHEKLKQSELKVVEQRNQCQSLRQELKVANKVHHLTGCIIDKVAPQDNNIKRVHKYFLC